MIGSAGNELLALLLNHRIERPHAWKIPARRAEYSLTENVASPFQAEPAHGQLAFRIPDSDREILHAVAENRSDLFVFTRDGRSLKLHVDAVQSIVRNGIEAVVATPAHIDTPSPQVGGRIRCGHFDHEELALDLQRNSLPSEALTRTCCWTEICRIRGSIYPPIDHEAWREICVTRGYLLARQNPRGF